MCDMEEYKSNFLQSISHVCDMEEYKSNFLQSISHTCDMEEYKSNFLQSISHMCDIEEYKSNFLQSISHMCDMEEYKSNFLQSISHMCDFEEYKSNFLQSISHMCDIEEYKSNFLQSISHMCDMEEYKSNFLQSISHMCDFEEYKSNFLQSISHMCDIEEYKSNFLQSISHMCDMEEYKSNFLQTIPLDVQVLDKIPETSSTVDHSGTSPFLPFFSSLHIHIVTACIYISINHMLMHLLDLTFSMWHRHYASIIMFFVSMSIIYYIWLCFELQLYWLKTDIHIDMQICFLNIPDLNMMVVVQNINAICKRILACHVQSICLFILYLMNRMKNWLFVGILYSESYCPACHQCSGIALSCMPLVVLGIQC